MAGKVALLLADVAKLVVHFEGKTDSLDNAYAKAKKSRDDFVKESNRQSTVTLEADSTGLEKSLGSASKSVKSFSKEVDKTNVDIDRDGSGAASLKDLDGGFKSLASSIRCYCHGC